MAETVNRGVASPGSAPPDLKLRGGGSRELQVLKMAAAPAGPGLTEVAAPAAASPCVLCLSSQPGPAPRPPGGSAVSSQLTNGVTVGGVWRGAWARPASHRGLRSSLRPGSGPPQRTRPRRGAAPHCRAGGREPPSQLPSPRQSRGRARGGGPPRRASPPCVLDAKRSPIGPCVTPLLSRILNIFFLFAPAVALLALAGLSSRSARLWWSLSVVLQDQQLFTFSIKN